MSRSMGSCPVPWKAGSDLRWGIGVHGADCQLHPLQGRYKLPLDTRHGEMAAWKEGGGRIRQGGSGWEAHMQQALN